MGHRSLLGDSNDTFPVLGKIISNGFVWNESYDCKQVTTIII